MFYAVQAAGTIPALLPYLNRGAAAVIQLEALHALYNLCKISRARQETAAVAGVVPYLAALALQPTAPGGGPLQAHNMLSASLLI